MMTRTTGVSAVFWLATVVTGGNPVGAQAAETAPPATPVAIPASVNPESAPTPLATATSAPIKHGAPVLAAPIDCAFCEAFAGQVADRKIAYRLERVTVRGNTTAARIIESFVRLKSGDDLDPNDPAISLTRWRLMATGWFDDVRLSLEKGKERGWVVLVIEVRERNTIMVERIVAGMSRVVRRSSDMEDELRPYGGLGITDANLLGLGIELSAAAVFSSLQQGIQLRYHDRYIGSAGGFSLRGRAFHNYAREFFGRNPIVVIGCRDLAEDDVCDMDVARERAVVIYKRSGLGIGTGHDIGGHLRYTLDWLGERVDVINKPDGATSQRGTSLADYRAINFHIEGEESLVSSLRLGFIFDTRDHPTLPGSGSLLRASGQLASPALGSDYSFARIEVDYRKYVTLPWGHGLNLGVFAGSVFGVAPFFYYFYAADLSDLLPSRQLELHLDHRRAPNLLDTSIREMDKEELAARVDFEYQLPVYSGSDTVREIRLYLGGGLFMLSRREDLRLGIPGYTGAARAPVDITFDVGVIGDTTMGIFKIGFSSLASVLPDLWRDER